MQGTVQKIMDAAQRDLAAAGATEAELRSANNVLAHLALHNTSGCAVELGRGVVVKLPPNPHARGFRTAGHIDTGRAVSRSH